MELMGLLSYGVFFLTLAGIYGLLSLGLNVQFGFTGQVNFGIAGFFAVGAYASAILTTPASDFHLGGFALPVGLGLVGAMVVSGVVGLAIGWVTRGLRADYLAIGTIGIAEILRLVLKNEDWLTNGVRGIPGIPRPLADLEAGGAVIMLVLVLAVIAGVYFLLERARRAPWGRVLRAIREEESAVAACGKNVGGFRLQAFVLGSMVMGLAGGLYAHFVGFISPEAFEPRFATFLVWVMLIAGGAANNAGALVGALLIWLIWSGTELVTGLLPPEWASQGSALRILLIGVLLEVILLWRPQGLLPERAGQ